MAALPALCNGIISGTVQTLASHNGGIAGIVHGIISGRMQTLASHNGGIITGIMQRHPQRQGATLASHDGGIAYHGKNVSAPRKNNMVTSISEQ